MPRTLADQVAQREALLEEIRQMLIEKLGVRRDPDEIDPDAPLFGSGLGLDSIDAVELIINMDERFRVQLPNDIGGRAEIRTVNALVDLALSRAQDP